MSISISICAMHSINPINYEWYGGGEKDPDGDIFQKRLDVAETDSLTLLHAGAWGATTCTKQGNRRINVLHSFVQNSWWMRFRESCSDGNRGRWWWAWMWEHFEIFLRDDERNYHTVVLSCTPGPAGIVWNRHFFFFFLLPFPSLFFLLPGRAKIKSFIFKFGAVNESIFSGIWGSARDKHETNHTCTTFSTRIDFWHSVLQHNNHTSKSGLLFIWHFLITTQNTSPG